MEEGPPQQAEAQPHLPPRKKKPKKRKFKEAKELKEKGDKDHHNHHDTKTKSSSAAAAAAMMDLDTKGKGNHPTGSGGGGGAAAAAAASSSSNTGADRERPEKGERGEKSSGPGASRKKKGNKVPRRASDANSTTTAVSQAQAQHHAATAAAAAAALSAAQQSVNEQMRRVLEEDQYSALGSIVETDSDEEDAYMYRGHPVRLDRTALQQAARKYALLEPKRNQKGGAGGAGGSKGGDGDGDDDDDGHLDHDDDKKDDHTAGNRKGGKGGKKGKDGRGGGAGTGAGGANQDTSAAASNKAKEMNDASMYHHHDPLGLNAVDDDDLDRDGGSIFGQTTGSSNSTWVECDKCKKWRRLRGVVDEKKLPTKWYCSMNKNDPERNRCSAPEEEYEATHTPESAADARTRKHLRVWVRRLQSHEAYEARQPTLTRGKKRAAASSSKEPYEWVRCCNPSCGKWRALLRIMDAKTSVIDRTRDGEWYCVMNTWDEKMASCAAPQENLPAVGCPSWVMQDE